ncbi:hypothetical protein KUTeg_002294 [Tegillarca granosa]|uniref:RUN domain-containing protein n=1 Tax=Tegillarca granosa TaxID=220873 RepID=A0ABQ9FTX4_TEGGR|nr:hypothetical protein KUTeg_002294 [Tegillarca granosa]
MILNNDGESEDLKMASVSDRLRLKDRIIANVSKAIKSVQECCSNTENPVILSNNSWQCHKLCEHFDHVFLHGLKHIGHGYWKVVTEFTRKNAIKEIKRLQNVTTDLGRGRAWLFMALNESSLESYLRCFEMNEKLVKKYYVKESLVLDQQRMNVLLTLTAGLEYAVFQLDYDVAYLDLNTYPPRSRAESEAAREDEDKSMLSTQGSNTALNDGDNVSVQSADTSSASHDSKTLSIDSGCNIDKNDTQDKLDELDTRITRLASAVSVNEECPDEDLGIEVIHSDSAVNRMLFEEEDDSTVLEEEEHDVGSLLDEPEYNGEIMLDNNTLLNLMLEVFEDSEEQFVKIFGTRMGHTEGETRTIFLSVDEQI